jgi:hypothetical protein
VIRPAALSVFLSPLEGFQATLEVIDVFVETGRDFPVARTSQPRWRLPSFGMGKPKEDQDSVKGAAIRGGSAHTRRLPRLTARVGPDRQATALRRTRDRAQLRVPSAGRDGTCLNRPLPSPADLNQRAIGAACRNERADGTHGAGGTHRNCDTVSDGLDAWKWTRRGASDSVF